MGKGNTFANGATNSGSNGDSGQGPQWQRRMYGWVADADCWTFMEPGVI